MKTNLLQKNIPKGWQRKQFENCVILPAKIKGLKNSEYKTIGKYPIFDQAKDYISGYSDDQEFLNNNIPAILFGDHTRILKYIKSPFVVGADGTKVFWAREDIDATFLYYSLLNLEIPNTGYNRHFKFLKDSEILLPSISEQKKIAEILGAVDEEIEKTDAIIAQTEKLKKGLMRELFTKGIGHKKFKKTKIGDIPEDWTAESLDDVCSKIIGGGTPPRNIKEYWRGDIPWVTVKDLSEKKFINDAQEYITTGGLSNSAANLIPPNSIITSTRMGIGRFYINKKAVAINQDLKGLIVKDTFDLDYIYYFLLSRSGYLESKGTGTTVKGIKVEELKGLGVPVPTYSEQKKIGEIFTAVDEKIVINKNLKGKLNQLKKGLMSDLLSGKVRTSI